MAPETFLGLLRFLACGIFFLLVVLWLVSVLAPRKCAGWGFAFWFPLFAISVAASILALTVLKTATSPSEGMGGGTAKFGAFVVFTYTAPALIVFLTSLSRFPRRREDYRLPSILKGFGLLTGFVVSCYSLYHFPRL